jgi:hypothetical protein
VAEAIAARACGRVTPALADEQDVPLRVGRPRAVPTGIAGARSYCSGRGRAGDVLLVDTGVPTRCLLAAAAEHDRHRDLRQNGGTPSYVRTPADDMDMPGPAG